MATVSESTATAESGSQWTSCCDTGRPGSKLPVAINRESVNQPTHATSLSFAAPDTSRRASTAPGYMPLWTQPGTTPARERSTGFVRDVDVDPRLGNTPTEA